MALTSALPAAIETPGVGVSERLLRHIHARLATTRLDFHAIVAKSAAMPSPWRSALISAIALAALARRRDPGRANGSGRARDPADRQQRDAGNQRDQGRCRRQGRRRARATPAGASPSARASRRCGPRPTSGRSAEAPNLTDSVLDGLVSSIVVEREQIGPNRYIAELGVLFDRTRAGELLGVGGPQQRSAPMLLIPLMITAGTVTTVELQQSVAARLGAVSHLAKRDRLCPGQRAGGRSACWSTPRRRGARGAAGGATSSIFTARRTCWSPRSASTGSIPAGRREASFIGALRPRRRPARQLRADRQGQRRHSADDGRGRRADGRTVHAGARRRRVRPRQLARHSAAAAAGRGRGRRRRPTSRSTARWRCTLYDLGERRDDADQCAGADPRRSTGSSRSASAPTAALIVNYPRRPRGAARARWRAGGWSVDLSGGVLRISRGAVAAPPPRSRAAPRRRRRRQRRRPRRRHEAGPRPDRASARLAAGRGRRAASSSPTPIARRSTISAAGACGRSRRPC